MINSEKQYWDVVGDIHGRHASLVRLLDELGYQENEGGYTHPEGRGVIFVGDFIDKGPNSLDVLRLVRRMVENGQALAVMGNHEFNFVSYMTPDGKGGQLRERTEKNVAMVKATLHSFHGREGERDRMIEWMKGLPFFLEMEDLRVVHASWIQEDIEYLRGKSLADADFLKQANREGSREFQAIENVLKGVEAPLPDGMTLPDANGVERKNLRVKWWESLEERKTWKEIAFPPREDLPEGRAVFDERVSTDLGYSPELPPVFFGHYKLSGLEPFAASSNIACLDYGLGHEGKATAYRWSGEREIDEENFIQVDAEPDLCFEVWVDDNFHYMDDDERYSGGRYVTYEEALDRAKQIVEDSLQECHKTGMSAEDLYGSYSSFGEDPWVFPVPEGIERFSARSYAKERAIDFCAESSEIEK